MASPDFSEYITLPLNDRDPQDVFDDAIVNLKSYFPEWTPREGNMEVLLLEALALEVAEAIFAINRLPDAIAEILLSMLDIERFSGTPPKVDIRFELGITTGTTIPAGVTAVLSLDEGYEPIIFTIDNELVIPPGVTSGIVSATGDRYTSDANGIVSGTLLEVQDALTYVNYAKTNSIVTGGIDPEEDIEFLTRGVQRMERLTTTLLLPRHFETAALESPLIKRAKAIDNYNSVADIEKNGPVGNDPGYIAVAVYSENEAVPTAEKDRLQAFFDVNSMANLVVTIIDPTVTPIDISAEIHVENGALDSDVIDAVEAALIEHFNTEVWPWSEKVRRNEIISIITNVPGVDYVESVTEPDQDITLPGVANLVKTGVLNITSYVE
jgi:uncharacterized phage protein gp47/JayE